MMSSADVSFNFSDKVVVIFGGSRGIGKEITKQFIISGARTYYVSRGEGNLTGATHIGADLLSTEDISRVFDKIKDVDFVINVAGTNLCEKIEEINEEEWDRVLDTNLKSFFTICRLSVEIMKKKNYGRIVNVSSIAGRNNSIVSGVHYTSSKYGIIGLTRQLSREVSPHNIRVNCTCPSQTMTEMLEDSMTSEQIRELERKIPARRISTPLEQAMPVLFLCSSASDYMYGAVLDINGGQL